MTKETNTTMNIFALPRNPLRPPAAAADSCRSLGGVGKAAALQHLLGGVKLGWEFTPAAAAASAASTLAPVVTTTTTTTTASAGVSVSDGPSELGHEGRQTREEEGEVVAERKPTLLLLHGFMGSKVCWERLSRYRSSP